MTLRMKVTAAPMTARATVAYSKTSGPKTSRVPEAMSHVRPAVAAKSKVRRFVRTTRIRPGASLKNLITCAAVNCFSFWFGSAEVAS